MLTTMEKKHWLLIIALACTLLWWYSTQIKKKELPWLEEAIKFLPAVGGLLFASEAIIKLAK